MSRSVGDGAGGAQAAVSRETVQMTRDAVVYPAQEEGRGQREDALGMEHPMRGSRKNRGNRWYTPWASQGRAGEERDPGQGARSCRPWASGKRRSNTLMARRTQWRRAQEAGLAGAKQDEGAAKRARGAQAEELEHTTERKEERQDETVK